MTPALEFVAKLSVSITTPLVIGKTDQGLREVIPIAGGTVEGPRLNGHIVPGGADWCTTRPDGAVEVSARYTLQMNDGAYIGVLNTGVLRRQPDGSWAGRTTPKFEAAAPQYDWMRNCVFIGTLLASADGTRVEMAFYAVT